MFRLDPRGFLRWLVGEHGDFVEFDLGDARHHLVAGAELTRSLLVERAHLLAKPEFMIASNRGHWGDGLTTLEGQQWRSRRQALRPWFAPERLVSHRRLVARMATNTVQSWGVLASAELLDAIRILTAQIAAASVFGAEVEGYEGGGSAPVLPFGEAYGDDYLVDIGGLGGPPLKMRRPRAPKAMPVVEALVESVVAKRRAAPSGTALAFLAELRGPEGQALCSRDICDELIQMLYAGHHTFPSTLETLFRHLASAPDDQARIRAESITCASELADLSAEELRASWAWQALHESMRLQPAAPILYRTAVEALHVDGRAIAKGSSIWFAPYLLQTDPRHYDSPLSFRPARFATSNAGAQPGVRPYYPFGAGPRTCIANRLAIQQMTLIVHIVLRSHQSRLSEASRVALVPIDE